MVTILYAETNLVRDLKTFSKGRNIGPSWHSFATGMNALGPMIV